MRPQKMLVTNDYSLVYERDSMERFGDDLTEEVIQYLWLEEKVKFEYVSKQWQRLVFNKQIELHLNSYRDSHRMNSLYYLFVCKKYVHKFDRRILKSVLMKCPNISRVYLKSNDMFIKYYDISLKLVTKYCRRVTKLMVSLRMR